MAGIFDRMTAKDDTDATPETAEQTAELTAAGSGTNAVGRYRL